MIWDGAGENPFAIKLATDHPHADVIQPEKTLLREEVREALLFAEHVRAVDERLGRDPELILLTESIGISVPGSETGLLVRDLAPLLDGHYYLPAFSIPFVGVAIASAAGESFAGFWGEAYAEPIGRAKNATAKVASDASVADAGSVDGKNSRGKTSTAAVA